MKNKDRIRNMTDIELTKFLIEVNTSYSEPCMIGIVDCPHDGKCEICFYDWLNKESEEECIN